MYMKYNLKTMKNSAQVNGKNLIRLFVIIAFVFAARVVERLKLK